MFASFFFHLPCSVAVVAVVVVIVVVVEEEEEEEEEEAVVKELLLPCFCCWIGSISMSLDELPMLDEEAILLLFWAV